MTKLLICCIMLYSALGQAFDYKAVEVLNLARNNGLEPNKRVICAIVNASKLYNINHLELTAIGIIETKLGKDNAFRVNKNGTLDQGIFQINTVNAYECIEYNLDNPEGSAMCAAKLLANLKKSHKDYLGVYHSKTKKKKANYLKKVAKVLNENK